MKNEIETKLRKAHPRWFCLLQWIELEERKSYTTSTTTTNNTNRQLMEKESSTEMCDEIKTLHWHLWLLEYHVKRIKYILIIECTRLTNAYDRSTLCIAHTVNSMQSSVEMFAMNTKLITAGPFLCHKCLKNYYNIYFLRLSRVMKAATMMKQTMKNWQREKWKLRKRVRCDDLMSCALWICVVLLGCAIARKSAIIFIYCYSLPIFISSIVEYISLLFSFGTHCFAIYSYYLIQHLFTLHLVFCFATWWR